MTDISKNDKKQYRWYLQYIQVLWIQDFKCSEYIFLPLTHLNQKIPETEDDDHSTWRSTSPYWLLLNQRTVWRTKEEVTLFSCEDGMLLGNTDTDGRDERHGKPVSGVRNCTAKMTSAWCGNWGASSKHLPHPSIPDLWRLCLHLS